MLELQGKIAKATTMDELDELRLPIVQAMENADDAELFHETQKLFIKRKNKIKRHGGRINDK